MSLKDTIYIPAYILVIAMTIFIALYVWIAFQTTFTDTINQGAAQGIISAANNITTHSAMADVRQGLNAIDYTFPIIVIGLMLISLVFAFKSGAGVIYSIISVVFWAFAVFFSMIFSNIFELFATSFPTEGAQFIIITWMMANMKWITLGWVFLISVVMFTQNRQDRSGFTRGQQILYGGEMYG